MNFIIVFAESYKAKWKNYNIFPEKNHYYEIVYRTHKYLTPFAIRKSSKATFWACKIYPLKPGLYETTYVRSANIS